MTWSGREYSLPNALNGILFKLGKLDWKVLAGPNDGQETVIERQ